MTDTTHPALISRRTRRQLVAAAITVITAIVVTVTAVVTLSSQRDASVGAVERLRPATVVAAPGGLSTYARAHDLTGLSPAGLTRRAAAAATTSDPDPAYRIYREIARYASTHDLSGLSPASLAPLASRAGR